MNVEAAAIGAASGAVMAALGIAGFWSARAAARTTMAERLARCEEAGDSALRVAADVENDMKDLGKKHSAEVRELHIKIDAANAAWTIRWEAALREFVSQDTIRDMESRLMAASAASEKRLMDAINGLVRRVDNVMDHRGNV